MPSVKSVLFEFWQHGNDNIVERSKLVESCFWRKYNNLISFVDRIHPADVTGTSKTGRDPKISFDVR